jgi:competence protein ComEC
VKSLLLRFVVFSALLTSIVHADWQGPARIRVHAIDVSQASATLVETKCGAILIDAGAGYPKAYDHLLNYLRNFFANRPDLNKTLESVILTHCHVDHTKALLDVVSQFNVKRFIYNGLNVGSGSSDQKKVLQYIQAHGGQPRPVEILDSLIQPPAGLTNGDIDPLSCADCDPTVKIFAGGLTSNPGWPNDEFKNPNNHSLVVRIGLGNASLMITGDLELHGLDRLVSRFPSAALQSNLLIVGHHGAKNAVTDSFLSAVRPLAAIISCGRDNDPGYNPLYRAWQYGHPTKLACDTLGGVITGTRTAKKVVVGLGKRNFIYTNPNHQYDRPPFTRTPFTVRKKIYCTAWDGDIVVDALPNGQIRVTSKPTTYHPDPQSPP